MIINKAKQRCISNPNKVINEGANLIVGFLAKSANLTLNEKKTGRTKNRDSGKENRRQQYVVPRMAKTDLVVYQVDQMVVRLHWLVLLM